MQESPWPERDGELEVFWAEGHSTQEIARRMHITKNSVVGRAHRLHLPPRPSPIIRSGLPSVRRQPARVTGPPLPVLASMAGGAPIARAVAAPVAAVPAPRAAALPLLRHEPVARRDGEPPCCWPIGDPRDKEDFRFCIAAALPGRPYCAGHCAIAFVTVRDRREDEVGFVPGAPR